MVALCKEQIFEFFPNCSKNTQNASNKGFQPNWRGVTHDSSAKFYAESKSGVEIELTTQRTALRPGFSTHLLDHQLKV